MVCKMCCREQDFRKQLQAVGKYIDEYFVPDRDIRHFMEPQSSGKTGKALKNIIRAVSIIIDSNPNKKTFLCYIILQIIYKLTFSIETALERMNDGCKSISIWIG